MAGREKIAILGGGLGAISAAYHLTRQPDQARRYDITVYQRGWRLGGKCASGRNAAFHERIEEHGIHVMFGFYDAVFSMLQETYDALARPVGHPLRSWRDGFTQHDELILTERVGNAWLPWTMRLPRRPGVPGTPRALRPHWALVSDLIEWTLDHALATLTRSLLHGGQRSAWLARRVAGLFNDAFALPEHIVAKLREKLGALDPERATPMHHYHEMHGLLTLLAKFSERLIVSQRENHALRRDLILLDFLLTNARGVLADHLLWRPLSSINQLDYREWLSRHGGTPTMLSSALVRAFYDLVFAYPGGDDSGPGQIEAGAVLSILLRSTTYRGSVVWRFRSGMGDVVFTPLYEVLRERGVKFRFFNRVTDLRVDAARRQIEEIHISRQVRLRGPDYHPLRSVAGLDCWPSEPLYDQLDEPAGALGRHELESIWSTRADSGGEQVLRLGQDFDRVVLGIPPEALPHVAPSLLAASQRWQDMFAHLHSVETQSLQLYCKRNVRQLGFTQGQQPPLIGTFNASPLSNWADVSEIAATERWQAGEPGSVSFFTGVLPGPERVPPAANRAFPQQQRQAVRQCVSDLLDHELKALWPRAVDANGRFDCNELIASQAKVGAARLQDQFITANIDPSERYVQSFVDSSRHRLPSKDPSFSNLYLAGDWTDNPINIGCAEATVLSGESAAQAILDAPSLGGPRYVSAGAQQSFPAPVTFRKVTMDGFVVEGDRARISAYCKRIFDQPSGGEVQVVPLSHYMVLAFVDMPHGVFDAYQALGYGSSREVDLFVPVAIVRKHNGRPRVEKIALFAPCVFVDNAVALTTGREVWGWPKQQGWLTMPSVGAPAAAFTLDTIGSEHYGPDQPFKRLRLAELRPLQPPAAGHGPLWPTAGSALSALRAIFRLGAMLPLPELDLVAEFDQLVSGALPMVFLKQVRDARSGEAVCYQAIIESPGQVLALHGQHFADRRYQLELAKLDSHRLDLDFGLQSQIVATHFQISTDLRFGAGVEIWRADT